jgi:putative endonuclease
MLYGKSDFGFYVGITNNLTKRLEKHNRGEVTSTKNRRTLILAYSKKHKSYGEARQHEKCLKKKSVDYKFRLAQLAPPSRAG